MKVKLLKTEIVVFLLFLGLGLLVTLPLVFRMQSHIYGYPGDPMGTIYNLWWWQHAWSNNLEFGNNIFLNAPFGQQSTVLGNQSLYTFLPGMLLSRMLGEIFTYNFFILLSFPLSAFTMYLLAYYLTRHRTGSIIAGIIYSLSPFHFSHSFQHLTMAAIQWMPLYLLFLFRLRERGKFKDAIICGFLFSVVALDVYYYGYFMTIVTLLFLCFPRHLLFPNQEDGIPAPSPKKTVILYLTACLVSAVIIIPWLFPVLKTLFVNSDGSTVVSCGYIRPFKDLFYYSAKLLNYLLPSSDHPVLGGITRSFLNTVFYGHSTTEHTLYLGWMPIVLAIIAVKNWRREKRKFSVEGFLIALVLVGFIFSQSPYWPIGKLKIFFPSYFMFKILPMFRVYSRFGLVVTLAVSLLAAIGVKVMLKRVRTRTKEVVTFFIITLIILFEFLNVPPLRVTNVSNVPPVYAWLAEQPGDFIVAEYPVSLSPDYLFYQRIHRKKLVNGFIYGKNDEVRMKELQDLDVYYTPVVLASRGVKYAIVHLDKLSSDEEYIKSSGVRDGLKLVKEFENVEVYEVVAREKFDYDVRGGKR